MSFIGLWGRSFCVKSKGTVSDKVTYWAGNKKIKVDCQNLVQASLLYSAASLLPGTVAFNFEQAPDGGSLILPAGGLRCSAHTQH